MLTILLPAYNEEEALIKLVPRISEALNGKKEFNILIVNDGSKDNTEQVAKKLSVNYPVIVKSHQTNLGLGAAIRTGLKTIIEEFPETKVIAVMDADDTHNPGLIPDMLKKLGENDIVIASRYADGGQEIGLPFYRQFLSLGANLLLKTFFPIVNCKDYTCGYRAYRVDVIKDGLETFRDNLIEENSFVCMAELLIKLASIGARVDEVGLKLRYDLKKGSSKMKIIYTILRYFKLIHKNRKILKETKGRSLIQDNEAKVGGI